MKHIKSREEFNRLDEQLFGKATNKILSLLGWSDEIKEPDASVVNGEVVSRVTGNKGDNIKVLIETMKKYGITNPYTQIAILGVIGKETGYIPKNEIGYGSTSNERIRKIFGSRVKDLSDSELTALKSNEVKFFDRVYGPDDPTGNGKRYGNTQPGDGYKYRGRGFNGITFKTGYEKMQQLLDKMGKLDRKVNIVSNPDSLNDVDVAAEVAAIYFLDRASNPIMARKYGVSDINGFKDQDTAIKAMANANAGWGSNIETDFLGSVQKSRDQAAQFKIDSTGTASMA
jgi:predicted chitinase